jgi:hypothetical protein
MERAMKTTVEVSDDLYRRAKAEAALRGRKLKDLSSEPGRADEGCTRSGGFSDSGPCFSNPGYLTGFGHDARRHR